MAHIYLAFAIFFEVLGTISLKWSATTGENIYGALTAAAYAASFYLLWLSLKHLPLGLAYATWSGVGIAMTSLIGVLFFYEKIDLTGIIGLTFILIGIILINIFSTMANH